MIRKHAFTAIAFFVLMTEASPALAGVAPGTPAPIAGVGLGAIAAIGLGYRALKRRSQR